MQFLWASESRTSTTLIIIFVVVFAGIFVALFLVNMFSAKYKITFYVDGVDVAKLYVKYKAPIVIPEEMQAFKWYTDEACTVEFVPDKMGLKEINLYTVSPNKEEK